MSLRSAALRGETWRGYDGKTVVPVPATFRHQLWSSEYRSRVHVAVSEGVVVFHGEYEPRPSLRYLCGVDSYLHDVPVGPEDPRPLCRRCVAKYRD